MALEEHLGLPIDAGRFMTGVTLEELAAEPSGQLAEATTAECPASEASAG